MPALPPALSPLDDDRLRQRAGARSFGLGVEYQRDAWCKHVVAVALAWRARRAGHADGPDAVEEFLATLDREQLVALLREQAAQDPALDRGLRLRATAANASADDEELIARFARQLDDALDPGGFLDRHEVLAYREAAEQAIDGLRSLLDAGRATAVIALAERLMDWELDSDWDTFYAADQTYADVLGDSGLGGTAQRRRSASPVSRPADPRTRSNGHRRGSSSPRTSSRRRGRACAGAHSRPSCSAWPRRTTIPTGSRRSWAATSRPAGRSCASRSVRGRGSRRRRAGLARARAGRVPGPP